MATTSATPLLRDRRLAAARVLAAAETAFCRVPGCANATSLHKPYCLTHLACSPYVRALEAELSRRDAEESAALDPRVARTLDPNGSRAQEILEELGRRGPQTFERLAHALNVPVEAVCGYLRALERAGLVRTLRMASRRGGYRRLAELRAARSALRTAS